MPNLCPGFPWTRLAGLGVEIFGCPYWAVLYPYWAYDASPQSPLLQGVVEDLLQVTLGRRTQSVSGHPSSSAMPFAHALLERSEVEVTRLPTVLALDQGLTHLLDL